MKCFLHITLWFRQVEVFPSHYKLVNAILKRMDYYILHFGLVLKNNSLPLLLLQSVLSATPRWIVNETELEPPPQTGPHDTAAPHQLTFMVSRAMSMTAHCLGDRLLASPAMWSCRGIHIYIQGISLTLLTKATYNHSFTHSHTDGGVNHAGRQPARQERSGLGALLRDTSTR